MKILDSICNDLSIKKLLSRNVFRQKLTTCFPNVFDSPSYNSVNIVCVDTL